MQRLLSCLLITASAATAQNAADLQDTTRLYLFEEIVVTATRAEISFVDSPSPVEVFGSREIENSNGSTVADLLRHSNSIFLRDYGATGSLKTASMRGTASEHLLVLVNGVRFNSFQNGLADLSLLPLSDVERVEVLRGGTSALYGADALGGVVNILTRRSPSATRVRARVATGSFNHSHASIDAGGRFGETGFVAGFMRESGRDDFPFRAGGLTLRQKNSDFERRQLYIHGEGAPDEFSVLALSAQHVRMDRGVPGPTVFPSELARQDDNDFNGQMTYTDRRLAGMEFTLRSNYHYHLQHYDDPDFGIASFHKNRFGTVNPQVQFPIGSASRIVAGGEFAEGSLVSADFDSRVKRVQKSFYLSTETQINDRQDVLNRISLYGMIRYDDVSSVSATVNPKLGLNVRVTKDPDFRVRASLGRSFRAPSFNDLYFRGFSNPDLKPEYSTGIDAGIVLGFRAGGEHTLDLTYFHLRTRDRILFDLAQFIPVNIGRVRTSGLEFRYEGRFFDDISVLGINYSLTDARDRTLPGDPAFGKQLPSVPRHLINVRAGVQFSAVSLNVVHGIVSERFTNADNSQNMGSYQLLGGNAIVRIPAGALRMQLKGEVNNALNENYEVMPFFPTPGRSYRIGFAIEY